MAGDEVASDIGTTPPRAAPERSLKLKISKKAYVFDVRKKYAATRNFVVKKKSETPADDIKENLSALFNRKKKLPGLEKGSGQSAQGDKKQSSTLKTTITISAALFLLFILAIIVIVMQYGAGAGYMPPIAPTQFSGNYSFSVEQSRLLSVGQVDEISRAGYLLLDFSSRNITAATFMVSVFNEKPITQVFMLDHSRESADTYSAFRAGLASDLLKHGIMINDMGLESLSSLPVLRR